jgi:adenylate cyclase
MIVFDDAADAVRFAIEVDERAAREERFPALRVGIHSGPVLYRVGDYVGTTVNIASRITTSAAASEIVISEPVADAARRAGIAVEPLGLRLRRGVGEPIGLFRVMRTRHGAQTDPVCGMVVSDAAARLTWDGLEHAFCSQECLQKFVSAPAPD